MSSGEKDNFYKNSGISANWSGKIVKDFDGHLHCYHFCVILPFPNHTKLVINKSLNQNGQWFWLRVPNWCRAWDQTPATSSFLWDAWAAWHSPASWASPQVRAALPRLLPVCSRGVRHLWVAFQFPPDHLPGLERGSLSAFPRATSQSSALLVRQDAQGLLLIPLQEEISCLHSMSPIRVWGVLVLVFGGPSLCPMFSSKFLPRG